MSTFSLDTVGIAHKEKPAMDARTALQRIIARALAQHPPHSAAAAPQPISNPLLGEPGLAPPAGTLLAALSGPEQDDDRQENKHRHPGGEASDRHS